MSDAKHMVVGDVAFLTVELPVVDLTLGLREDLVSDNEMVKSVQSIRLKPFSGRERECGHISGPEGGCPSTLLRNASKSCNGTCSTIVKSPAVAGGRDYKQTLPLMVIS